MRYDKLYERLASRAVKQASIDIEAFVDQLSESGASAERINELLMQDLANDGPLFGRFMRSLTGAAIATTTAAARQGEIAMTAMPTVAPRPSVSFSEPFVSTSPITGTLWSITVGTTKMLTMMMTLASTGDHAAAKNRRRALSNDVPSAERP